MLRRSRLVLAALALTLLAVTASAAPLDKAANKKIDEAVNQHYLATSFRKAESVLLGTLKACGHRCSRSVQARAWMYIGIVRGSGKNDLAGAKKAFEYAVYVDRNVKLDAALATPKTKAAFRQAKASGGRSPPAAPEPPSPRPSPGPAPSPAATQPPPERGIECTPKVREVQTRRPIPMQCTSGAEATGGQIRYKEYGGEQWQTARMVKKGAAFQGTIPCAATMLAGKLQVHVILTDPGGNVVDTLGSLSNPMEFTVIGETAQPPPTFPDQPPPARCPEEVECPPDFPGCKAGRGDKVWGDSCDESSECRHGLVCVGGRCENAQSCDVDADCPDGVCIAGACESREEAGPPYKKNWFGLHVAQDITPVGGDSVCSTESQENDDYACFQADAPYPGTNLDPNPAFQGKVENGMAAATTRFLASYERALMPKLTVGARLGAAIGGGPTTQDGTSFLWFHGELRVAYYFLGLRERFRPYAHLGGGMAQIDTKVTGVQVINTLNNVQEVDVWKKTGQSFATLGAGVVIGFSDNVGAKLNVNGVLLFPSFGVSIQPSLGFVLGI